MCDPQLIDATAIQEGQQSSLPPLLSEECEFYSRYTWSLDPHLPIAMILTAMRCELEAAMAEKDPAWQRRDIRANLLLLIGAVSTACDEFIRGDTLRMPRALTRLRTARSIRWGLENASLGRHARAARMIAWRSRWIRARDMMCDDLLGGGLTAAAASGVEECFTKQLPKQFLKRTIGIPSAFGKLGMAPDDVIELAGEFIRRYPDRHEKIIIVGIRTGGSYFVPIICAELRRQGYTELESVTVQPDKGLGREERRTLRDCGRRGYMALIVDDPPHTGETLALALEQMIAEGFTAERCRILLPTLQVGSGWPRLFPEALLVRLPQERWLKQRILTGKSEATPLRDYYESAGYSRVSIARMPYADAQVPRRGRMPPAIFRVKARTSSGALVTHHVEAKAVGWGWLGYRAFVAGQRLAPDVVQLLGLRDGILYSRSFPASDRVEVILPNVVGRYIGRRVLALPLGERTRRHTLARHENALNLLRRALSRAYGPGPAEPLVRARLERDLAGLSCAVRTYVDGSMAKSNWSSDGNNVYKSDYEQRGLGKSEANVSDPAFDLAAAVLSLGYSKRDENDLIESYVAASQDHAVRDRLTLNKLLAGLWAMNSAQERMFEADSREERLREHSNIVSAWTFLTIEAARFCGSLYEKPDLRGLGERIVCLDVDGVIDRRMLGFPCITAAGIEALSRLAAHGLPVVLNTARSALEVKEYCLAYGFVGGAAENGSVVWDARSRRSQSLVTPQEFAQLQKIREILAAMPGVFVDERHCHSVKAYVYARPGEGIAATLRDMFKSFRVGMVSPQPLPELMVRAILEEHSLNLLEFHSTTLDTMITAKGCDKGRGLRSIIEWLGAGQPEVCAVGDSSTDLSMFAAADLSFAPQHIDCAREARLLGCEIMDKPYQRGFRQAVERICPLKIGERRLEPRLSAGERTILEALAAADSSAVANILKIWTGRRSKTPLLQEPWLA